MFIFPNNRHEKINRWYQFNIVAILVAFLNLMASPAYAAFQHNKSSSQQSMPVDVTEQAALNDTMAQLQDLVRLWSDQAGMDTTSIILGNDTSKFEARSLSERQQLTEYLQQEMLLRKEARDIYVASNPLLSSDRSTQIKRFDELLKAMEVGKEEVLSQFSVFETRLLSGNVPDVIMKRHYEAVDEFNAKYDEIYQSLDRLSTNISGIQRRSSNTQSSNADLTNALNLLKDIQTERTYQDNGPSNIRLVADEKNLPETTPLVFEVLRRESQQQLMQARKVSLEPRKNPAAPDYKVSGLAGANNPAYLGETTEVVITDRIKLKAKELKYNPVRIYYWVLNNVEWVPTWGAYQSAEHTLGSLQGNSHDTATLLIALLRASNIPARYVKGTVEVEGEQFSNWVGNGFASPQYAASYASSLGLPVQTVNQNFNGKRATKIRLSHIWVETALDYFPSRGEKNLMADSWIPMDASFKQYKYKYGFDIKKVGGVDLTKTLGDFAKSSKNAGKDSAWVQNLDLSVLSKTREKVRKNFREKANTLIKPTVADAIGKKKVIVKSYPLITATLPMKLVVKGAEFAAIPSNQQVKIGLGLKTVRSIGIINIPTRGYDDDSLLTYYPLSQWNSERSFLQFSPTTEADEQALIAAQFPKGAKTVEQLPEFLPAYSINVTPELVLNGKVVQKGDSMRLGREVQLMYKDRLVNRSGRPMMRYNVIAGSFLHVPVIGYSINPFKFFDIEKNLRRSTRLLQSDENNIYNLTRDDILGDYIFAGGLTYFQKLHTYTNSTSFASDSIGRVLIGYGSYGREPKLRQNGILALPIGISTRPNVSTNMRTIETSIGKSSSASPIGLQLGIYSSILESAIPEEFYCKERNPANYIDAKCSGISAVSGIGMAMQQGQKIYKITQANKSELKNISTSGEEMVNDMNRAINAGGYVIVPEKAVRGSGRSAVNVYITSQMGYAAWKISGGLNGGIFEAVGDGDFLGAARETQKLYKSGKKAYDTTIGLIKDFKKLGKAMKAGRAALGDMLKDLVKKLLKKYKDKLKKKAKKLLKKPRNYGPSELPSFCLTPTQADSLMHGISALDMLQSAPLPKGADAPLTIGVQLGYFMIGIMMLNFMKINHAIGDC